LDSPRLARFRDLVARDSAKPLFRFSLGQALAATADPAAEEHLQFCVNHDPAWMMPRILLGKLLLAHQRRAEARPLLAAALDLAIAQDHDDPAAELRALLADLGPDVTES
jgi:hypothetical protein